MAGGAAVGLKLPAERSTAIGRRELFLWVVTCVFANQALQLVDTTSLKSFGESLASQNYLFWFAVYGVFFRLRRADADVPASRRDLWAALAICAAIFCASFLPYRFGMGLLVTATAAYILLRHHDDRNLKAAGNVLLAVSAQLVWAPILFQLFTPELLRADAALVGEMLAWFWPEIIWRGTTFIAPDGHAIVLVGACSSFNNISSAVLACVTVIMLTRTEWRRGDIATIGIACIAMVIVNTFRICVISRGNASHLFWHNGIGEQILAVSQTLIILIIAWWGAAPRKSAR